MTRRFPLPAALLLALIGPLAACSDTSGARSSGDAAEAHGSPASGALAPDAPPLRTEVKRRIRTDQIPVVRAVFGLAEPEASRLEVTFYDTPSLELIETGLILRSRKVKDGDDDVTVKLRPLARTAVAADWFELDGFKCEADSIGATTLEACSLTVDRKGSDIDAVAKGGKSIESLFSGRQHDFIRTYARPTPDWNSLKAWGPIAAKEWEVGVQGLPDKVAAELWTLPDGAEMLEFSVKVPVVDAELTAAALEDAFRIRGVELMTDGTTKTRAALESMRAN